VKAQGYAFEAISLLIV